MSLARSACLLVTAVLWTGAAGAAVCEGMKGGPGDLDGDGFTQAADCDDADTSTWHPPDPIINLRFLNADDFEWDAPADPGTTGPLAYDLFRSTGPVISSSDCFDSVDIESGTDSSLPSPGVVFHYLAVARGDCGNGDPGHGRPALTCGCQTPCDDGDSCTADLCDGGQCTHPVIPPDIVVPPDAVASCDGGVAELSVTAAGSGAMSYQWFQDGQPIGANSPLLSLAGLTPEDNGSQITVEVTDGCATTASAPATLTVVADANSCLGGNSGMEPHWWLFTDHRALTPSAEAASGGFIGTRGRSRTAGSVHLFSGEFHLIATDLHIPGRGFDFAWRREYRSREVLMSAQGNQWDYSYNRKVEVDPNDTANRLVHDGSARIDVYMPDAGSGCWTAPGFLRELCEDPGDGSYTLIFADKHIWLFAALDGSAIEGKIVSSTDRNGNSMSFAYDAAGRLTTITDTLGRDITVGYNAQNLISAVTDFNGRTVSYQYYGAGELGGEAEDLKSCTTPAVTGTPTGNDFPSGKTTGYTYTQGFGDYDMNHNLRTITDPLGNVVLTNVYTPTSLPADPRFDRLDRQVTPSGVSAYLYVPQTPAAGNNFAVSKTIVNDRAGKVRHYSYDALNRLVGFRSYTGHPPDPVGPTGETHNAPVNPLRPSDPAFFETSIEYNADSLPTRVVLPEGNEIQWVYDETNPNRRLQGNLLTRARLPGPRGGDQTQIVEDFEHGTDFGFAAAAAADGDLDTSWFPTSYTDGRGNEYVLTYDANGNLETLTAPVVTIGQPVGTSQSIVHTWQYNGFGQPTQYTNPAGRVDRFTYHGTGPQTGYLHEAIVDDPGEALTTTFAYDDAGNVVSVTDPRGNTTGFIVNELNQFVCLTESAPFSYNTYLYYDAADRLVRSDVQNVDDQGVSDPDNPYFSADLQYDALDRPVGMRRELDENSCVMREVEWDGNDNPTLVRLGEAVDGNQPTNVVRTIYDERDLVFQVIRAEGDPEVSTTQLDYDGNGNTTVVRQGLEDPAADHVTTTGYDGYDRPVSVTDALGNAATLHYDANSNPTSTRVDEAGGGAGGGTRLREADLTYDEVDRLVQRDAHFFDPATQTAIGDGLATSKWVRAEDGRLNSVEDDNGNETAYQYDTARRLSLITDARGNTRSLGYDANSNLTGRTDTDVSDAGGPAEVLAYTYEYDELNRLTAKTDPLTNRWEALYDSRGNRTTVLDSLGNETRSVYDGLNRLLRTERDLTDTGMGGGTVVDTILSSMAWDDSSRVTGRTDDNGNTTGYAYDALNRLTGTTYADGTSHQFTYDVHDMPLTVTDANGSVQTNLYDALDRLESRTVSRATGVLGTTVESYGYDGLSRSVTAQNDDSIVTFSYDSMSNVVQETLKIGTGPQRTVLSTFDGVGNKLSVTHPSGRDVAMTYDALNRVDTISTEATTVMDYGYIGGRVETATRPSVETSYEYDDGGRVTRMTHTKDPGGAPQVIVDTIFGWDARYHLTGHTDQLAGGDDRSFEYDSAGRMMRAAIAGTSPQTVDYSLDGVGNRTTVSGGPDAGTYTMDPTTPEPADAQVNQYTTTPLTTRIYDANGNWTVQDLGMASEQSFAYDYRNRLVAVGDAVGGTTSTYAYDALGRRIQKVDVAGGQTTRFYYDGLDVVEEQDGTDLARLSYTNATMHEEADLNGNLTMDDYWYHGDHNGNVLAVTDAAGSVAESYRYGDYGAPQFFGGTSSSIPGTQVGNPYLFAGVRFDEETGFYHGRSGNFDPHAGRLTSSIDEVAGQRVLQVTATIVGGGSVEEVRFRSRGSDVVSPWTHPERIERKGNSKSNRFGPRARHVNTRGYSKGDYFVADSFSFGVEREMKESGEKGGTEDINIGVGELEECSMASTSGLCQPTAGVITGLPVADSGGAARELTLYAFSAISERGLSAGAADVAGLFHAGEQEVVSIQHGPELAIDKKTGGLDLDPTVALLYVAADHGGFRRSSARVHLLDRDVRVGVFSPPGDVQVSTEPATPWGIRRFNGGFHGWTEPLPGWDEGFRGWLLAYGECYQANVALVPPHWLYFLCMQYQKGFF